MRADSTHKIGTVAAVESERVTIEIDSEATGFVKAGLSGVLPIGALNSYLIIAAGSTLVVAVVTAIRMVPSAMPRPDPPFDAGSSITRTIEATMVGRLDGGDFLPGLTTFPSVFAPAYAATRADLEVIFRPTQPAVRFGEAVVVADQDVCLAADLLLGHHFAVLGTTGSGKSCTVMAVLDGLFELDLPGANIIIFDTNGEYAPCFAEGTSRAASVKAFTLGPEPGTSQALVLPQWFMNSEEHLELLRAAEGVQAPLLQRAVADARTASARSGEALRRLRVVRQTVETMVSIERNEKKIQEKLSSQLTGLDACLSEYCDGTCELEAIWTEMRSTVASRHPELGLNEGSWDPLTAPQRNVFEVLVGELRTKVREGVNALGLGASLATQDFDAPSYYSLEDLSEVFLPQRIDLEALSDPRIAAFAVSMQLRLNRLLADERYSFMTRVAPFDNSLAFYLRLLFGKAPVGVEGEELPESLPWRDAYEASGESGHAVTVVDLSLMSHDVLPTVTALIARLIIDLAQRMEPRARLPVLVVLEEAHRYVRRDSGTRSQAAFVFERVAKEGRKFGVSLALASQRPSELDPTVLSQCGTLIAHRIVGQVDQDIIRAATPLASRDILRQLPGLAAQHAIVLGDAVPAPVSVRVRQIRDVPDSRDPSFVQAWQTPDDAAIVEALNSAATDWESGMRRRTSISESEEPSGSNDPE